MLDLELMSKLKHPYYGVSPTQWANNLIHHGVDISQLYKYLAISKYSLKLAPYAIREDFAFRSIVNEVKIDKDPIFVIGHWRSGTTHLQNILTCDPQWGYLNTIQSVFPNLFLTMEDKLSSILPVQKRAMDNVKLGAKTPSEEEIALATMCGASFWQGYFFTDDMEYYFNKYVMFEGISQTEIKQWKNGYLKLLKKLHYKNDGKQLLLKNPPNTARVRFLLEMFPNAKFIHISRNPLDVFQSRLKQYDTAVRMKDLQNLSKEEWKNKTLLFYKLMMEKYLADKAYIPNGNLVEVSFEDLRSNPSDIVSKIYRQLDLPGYDDAKPHFEKYLRGLNGYEQNDYSYDPEVIATVEKHWSRYADAFGYDIKPLKIVEAG